MERIKLFDKTFKTFIPYEKIEKAIDTVADQVNADFEGCTDIPILLCVLNGSIMFTAELMKRLRFNCEVVSIKLSSYSGTSSTGQVRQVMGLTADITGRRIIIVEDIVDSGNTIMELQKILAEKGFRALLKALGTAAGLSFLALFWRVGAYPCGTVKGGMPHAPIAT